MKITLLKSTILSVLTVFLIACFQFSQADELAAQACEINASEYSYFPKTAKSIELALTDICLLKRDQVDTAAFERFTFAAINEAHVESREVLGEYGEYLLDLSGKLWSNKSGDIDYPSFYYVLVPRTGVHFTFDGERSETITREKMAQCDTQYGDCENKLKQLGRILNALGASMRDQRIVDVQGMLATIEKRWDSFGEEARSQNMLGIMLTTYFYEKNPAYNHRFQPPPKAQWHVLQPNIIIENVSDALDGDEIQEAIAIEILGYNRWHGEDGCFGLPCGVSAIATYADRGGVQDEGWGLMFHLDNAYSFGVTKHGSDTGFFINVDLMKFFEDKKEKVTDFRARIKEKLDSSSDS